MLFSHKFKIFILSLLFIWSILLLYFWTTPQYESSLTIVSLKDQLNDLKNQYNQLMDKANIVKLYKVLENEKSESLINENDKGLPRRSFTNAYIQRRLSSNLMELFNSVYKNVQSNFLNDQIFTLMAYNDLLREDPLESTWRKKELLKLENMVQDEIKRIQNPKNCDKAPKIICNLNKGCGFGCQMHHATYCLIFAYSTSRTLILESNVWRYGSEGWNHVFKPMSNGCLDYNQSELTDVWNGHNDETVKNIKLPIVDILVNRPDFLPQAIPEKLYTRLSLVHSDPFVWFVGQLLSYIMRLSTNMKNEISSNGIYSKIPQLYPVVGVHIRRTDKVGTEAQFHSVEEYMEHVEYYFKKEEIKANLLLTLNKMAVNQYQLKARPVNISRQIVLATDEPHIYDEIKRKYPNYKIIGNSDNARSASVEVRYGLQGLKAVIYDTLSLSQTNFLVCTFSSQVCRIAYELMQVNVVQSKTGDQGNQFKSLDDVYYFGGQQKNRMVMLQEYQKQSLHLKIGDTPKIKGNHWNGWSKGEFKNVEFLFPTYKAQFLHILSKMGNLSNNSSP